MSFVTLGKDLPSPFMSLQTFLQYPSWMEIYSQECPVTNLSNDRCAQEIGEIKQCSKKEHPLGRSEEMPVVTKPSRNPSFGKACENIDYENYHICPRIGCSNRRCAKFVLHQNTTEIGMETSEVKDEADEDTKIFDCPNCDFKSQDIEDLQKHKRKHRKRKRRCSNCGFTSADKIEMQTHRKKHGKTKSFAHEDESKSPVARKYSCESCSYKASQKVTLNVHMSLVHGVENLIKNIFNCKECPRRLLSSRKLEDHMKLHSPPSIPCDVCGKMFHTDQNLSKHNYAVHTTDGEKQLRCNECGKGFISRTRLRDHMNIHLGVKPHMCPHCGKHLSNTSNLQAHTRKLHQEHYKEGQDKTKRVLG